MSTLKLFVMFPGRTCIYFDPQHILLADSLCVRAFVRVSCLCVCACVCMVLCFTINTCHNNYVMLKL